MNQTILDQYAISIEKLADIENFDKLALEHWGDFNTKKPNFNKAMLSIGKTVTLRHNSIPVGYVLFIVHNSPFYDGEKWCSVNMYYLQKSHRGQGFGSDMFYVLENFAKEQGCVKIVSSFNLKQPLDSFYKKLGFSATHVGLAKEF